MKRLTTRVAIAACTFVVGIVAATLWLGKAAPTRPLIQPAPAQAEPPSPSAVPAGPDSPAHPLPPSNPDSAVHAVKLCDLIRNSNRYDGKVVRMRAFYNQGVDTSSLDDSACDEWLRPSCAAADEACDKIWDRITKVLLKGPSFRVRVDVVGRYSADVVDSNPLQGGSHVHMFEILELKAAKPAGERD